MIIAVCSHSEKSDCHFNTKVTETSPEPTRRSEARWIVDPTEPCVGVIRLEYLVEKQQTVVSIKHEIAILDRAWTEGIRGKASEQVEVLLVAVQLTHVKRQWQEFLQFGHG